MIYEFNKWVNICEQPCLVSFYGVSSSNHTLP